jgi:hypothetical protein
MISSQYRGPINYSVDIIEQCKASLTRLYTCRDSLDFALKNAPEGDGDLEKIKAVLSPRQAQFDEAMEDDLNTAVSLLEDDPIRGKASEAWLINANADGFWDARDKRMNYFAAKALKARVLLFRYELDAAAALAQEVITEATAAGACQWVDADAMTKATSNDVIDWTFSSEQLFSLEVTGLQSLTDAYIFNTLGSGSSSILIDKAVADLSLFNTATIPASEDIRGPALMLKFYGNQYRPYKYYNNSSYYAGYRNRIPMIKLSEMYLILAEVAAEKKDQDKLFQALTDVRSHRGIQDPSPINGDPNFISPNYWFSGLLMEIVREFNGENVGYFAARRISPKARVWVNIDANWVNRIISLTPYCYPTDELSYGRHQDL